LMTQELKVNVIVAEDPMTCVVRGCGKVLDDERLLRRVKII
jgi:actin-like ATPase involved in cell morphogenesis